MGMGLGSGLGLGLVRVRVRVTSVPRRIVAPFSCAWRAYASGTWLRVRVRVRGLWFRVRGWG